MKKEKKQQTQPSKLWTRARRVKAREYVNITQGCTAPTTHFHQHKVA